MYQPSQEQQPYSKPDATFENSSTRDILNVIFRRKKVILGVFWMIFLGVIIFTYISPEIYQSEAKVLIKIGRENLALDPTVDGPTVSLSQSRENEVNSELAIIKSRLLAERVVDKITPEVFLAGGNNEYARNELKPSFTPITVILDTFKRITRMFGQEAETSSLREYAINKMIQNLRVEVAQKSHVIKLSFESQNPQFGQQVLTKFLDLYLDHHIQVHGTQAPPQFFQDQVDTLSKQLQEKENDLEAFRATHNISSINIQKEALFTQIGRIESEIAEMNSMVAASRAHNASLEQGLRGRVKEVELGRISGKKSVAFDAIKAKLFDFRIKEADLSARYPDSHRELVEVRQQIKLAESALSSEKLIDEVTTGIDPTYQAMQLSLETGRAKLQAQIASLKALKEDLKKPKEALAALAKNEITEKRLKRDVSLLEEEYLQYRQDTKRTNISKALDISRVSNLSLIQPATIPLKPIKPQKSLNIIIGFLLGIFGGISLAFIIEYLDDSLNTKEDVEKRLELPVLASVPYEETRSCT